jgi:hypothetical protein
MPVPLAFELPADLCRMTGLLRVQPSGRANSARPDALEKISG